MEDIASLGFCSPNYFPFSNVKNEEYANIENLSFFDTEEDTISYGQESDKKSSKKHSFCSELLNVNSKDSESEKNIPQLHSCKKKKKKHSNIYIYIYIYIYTQSILSNIEYIKTQLFKEMHRKISQSIVKANFKAIWHKINQSICCIATYILSRDIPLGGGR